MAADRVIPAIEGWFGEDPEPHLLGTRCRTCGSYAFPPGRTSCPNPSCGGDDLDTVPLSRTGRVWSWTVNHYAPPPPYVAADPFRPFAVAAVELAEERMIVLGQVDGDPGALAIGDAMELVVAPLFEEEDGARSTWKWRRVGAQT